MTHVIVSKALMEVFSYTDQTCMFEALVNAKLYCARHVHTCLEEFEECNTKGKEYPVNAYWPDRATYWLAQANYFQKLLDTLELLPETEWNAIHTTMMVAKHPLKRVTEQHYHDMLNILPPLKQESGCFFMSEFEIGSWTTQYVRYYSDHFERIVDFKDETTWITNDQCQAFLDRHAVVMAMMDKFYVEDDYDAAYAILTDALALLKKEAN